MRCPNCGHGDHHGERCDGLADGDFCACSWPDPSNYATPPDAASVDEVVRVACEATSHFILDQYMREALDALAQHGYTIVTAAERERLDSLTASRGREYVVADPVNECSAFSIWASEFDALGSAERWLRTIDRGRGQYRLELREYESWSTPRRIVSTEVIESTAAELAPTRPKVVDLMAALEQSVAEAKAARAARKDGE